MRRRVVVFGGGINRLHVYGINAKYAEVAPGLEFTGYSDCLGSDALKCVARREPRRLRTWASVVVVSGWWLVT